MGEVSGTPNFESGMGYHSVNNTELEDRMIALIETVPFIDLTPNQIDNLSEELRDYHHIYSPLFARREQAQWAEKYMQGLLLDIPRKSIEPMVLALEGANPNAVRAMQHFASEGTWKEAHVEKRCKEGSLMVRYCSWTSQSTNCWMNRSARIGLRNTSTPRDFAVHTATRVATMPVPSA